MAASRQDRFLQFVENPNNVKRILVIRNGLIGDTVFVTPVFERLHESFPNARLDVATSFKSVLLLKNYSHINAVFYIPDKYSVKEHAKFFFSLRKFQYDIVIVQEVNSHYVLMAKLVMAKFLVGFENKLSFLLDFSVRRPQGVHAVLAEIEAVQSWTGSTLPVATHLVISEEELKESENLLKANGVTNRDPIVCIHPGCSGKQSEREWVPEYYSELADSLIQNKKVRIIFTGVEQDRNLVEKIIAPMKYPSVSIIGKTNLRQLLGVLKISKIVIGPDTGTLHLANAVGTPVVMLCGSNDPSDTGPFDASGKSKFVRVDLPCIGCVRRYPKPKQWDICKNIRPVPCMEKLSPQIVYEATTEILKDL